MAKNTPKWDELSPAAPEWDSLSSSSERPPVPEIVAGTPQQMREQRARNLQAELGLDVPIEAPGAAPAGIGVSGLVRKTMEQPGSVAPYKRFYAGMAPTPEEKIAFWKTETGGGRVIPISANQLLVEVPDGKGGTKMVLDNPSGLEVGDVFEMAANMPQVAGAVFAATKMAPGVAGAVSQVAIASGAAAALGNAIGAAQDVGFRLYTGQPINPKEILERRGLQAGIETAIGTVAPLGLDRLVNMKKLASAASSGVRRFIKEGESAKEAFKAQGINVQNSTQLADALRAREAAGTDVIKAGETLVSAINDIDQRFQRASQGLIERAGAQTQNAAMQQMQAIAPKASPSQVGLGTIGRMKEFVAQSRAGINKLYDDAYAEINVAAKASGEEKFFVSLKNTKLALEEIKSRLPRDDAGDTIATFQPLKVQLEALEKMTGATQKLDSILSVRTMLGEKLKGKGGPFENVSTDVASRLYKTISQDYDESIRAFSGPGADKLKLANEAYKNLVQPFEDSKLLDDIVNDGFKMNAGSLINKAASASKEEWAVLKTALPSNSYNELRRAVADSLMGSSEVRIGSQSFADLSALSKNINVMAKESPEVLDEIFGGKAAWTNIKRLADEQAFLEQKRGLFTKTAMPKQEELMEARRLAEEKGHLAANQYLRRAISAAEQRRVSLADSLASQIRNANKAMLSENAEQFVDALVFDGRHDYRYVQGIMKRLTPQEQDLIAKTAFQQLFERSRNLVQSSVSRAKNVYDVDKIAKDVFGSKQSQERVKAAIGPERFDSVMNFLKYDLALQAKQGGGKANLQRLAGLVSTAPYQNLFAARLTSTALEKAAGSRFISGATPEAVELFSQARILQDSPAKGALMTAALQKAASSPLYGDYLAMMQDFTPEQRNAIDAYLMGR